MIWTQLVASNPCTSFRRHHRPAVPTLLKAADNALTARTTPTPLRDMAQVAQQFQRLGFLAGIVWPSAALPPLPPKIKLPIPKMI